MSAHAVIAPVVARGGLTGGRLAGRAQVVARALLDRNKARSKPRDPHRILIAHHLLLGDTLMLTPLLKKLRVQHPAADIVMTVAEAIAPLYATRPYGVRVIAWNPRALKAALFAEAPFDLAYVPGENRYAWLAAAMRARWIVAFGGERSRRKSWPIDEFRNYRATPGAWGDLVAELVDGPPPPPYAASDWRAPAYAAYPRPGGPYALLHVGASSVLKQWDRARWRALADTLSQRGLAPVWSAGPGEQELVRRIDPSGRFHSVAAQLDLAQLWDCVANARLLVAPDTGIAHLGRIVATPTVTLFGPGSAALCGAGDFWRDARYVPVTQDPFPCRDQRILFGRDLAWVRRCGRSSAECPHPRCMDALSGATVNDAVASLL